MPMTWNHEFNNLAARMAAVPKNLEDKAAVIVQETVIEGAQQMRSLIDRIDTGQMLADVGNTNVQKDGTRVYAQFGWVDQVQPYYIYQEQGFRHYRSGKDVPPMHALLRAFINVREKFYGRIRELTS